MLCPICGTPNLDSAASCKACGAILARAANSAERLTAGTSLQHGAYVVDRVLGQGGFGITYLGSDTQLGRVVAIKEFFPTGCFREQATIQPSGAMAPADFDSARRRFLEEARTLARFRHAGIVDVFAAFEENNTAYMVMEYLLGKTLGAVVQERGRLEEAEAIRFIREVGDALSTVHEAGLLHRDIKPDNIMLCHDGRVVLIDFGTARDFSMGRTQGHTVVVTPGYAPLEQYAQRAQRGVFSDVYGLAATLFFLLTGEPPVPATDRAAGVEFVPPHHIVSSVSPHVGAAVQWAMNLKVEQRPQTVQEFLHRLTTPGAAFSQSSPRLEYSEQHEPAQSALEAWRYSKQSLTGLPLRPPRAIESVVPIDMADESPLTFIVATEENGFAADVKWPNQCACCGCLANTTFAIFYEPDETSRGVLTGGRVWNVPYCSECLQHIASFSGSVGIAESSISIGVFAGLILSLALVGTMVSPIPIVIWAVAAAASRPLRNHAEKLRYSSVLKTICTSRDVAVACTHSWSTPDGLTVYTFEFKNPVYRQKFEQLNRATSLSLPTA